LKYTGLFYSCCHEKKDIQEGFRKNLALPRSTKKQKQQLGRKLKKKKKSIDE